MVLYRICLQVYRPDLDGHWNHIADIQDLNSQPKPKKTNNNMTKLTYKGNECCKSPRPEVRHFNANGSKFVVISCSNCGSTTAGHKDEAAAVKAWNEARAHITSVNLDLVTLLPCCEKQCMSLILETGQYTYKCINCEAHTEAQTTEDQARQCWNSKFSNISNLKIYCKCCTSPDLYFVTLDNAKWTLECSYCGHSSGVHDMQVAPVTLCLEFYKSLMELRLPAYARNCCADSKPRYMATDDISWAVTCPSCGSATADCKSRSSALETWLDMHQSKTPANASIIETLIPCCKQPSIQVVNTGQRYRYCCDNCMHTTSSQTESEARTTWNMSLSTVEHAHYIRPCCKKPMLNTQCVDGQYSLVCLNCHTQSNNCESEILTFLDWCTQTPDSNQCQNCQTGTDVTIKWTATSDWTMRCDICNSEVKARSLDELIPKFKLVTAGIRNQRMKTQGTVVPMDHEHNPEQCPNCQTLPHLKQHGHQYFIHCSVCGLSSLKTNKPEAAIEHWNHLADDARLIRKRERS